MGARACARVKIQKGAASRLKISDGRVRRSWVNTYMTAVINIWQVQPYRGLTLKP